MTPPAESDRDDVMRTLLRQLRSVPPVSAERQARARARVHAAWLDATAPRTPSRWWWAGAVAAAVVSAVAALLLWPATPGTREAGLATPMAATARFVTGAVELRDAQGGAARRLLAGEPLPPGTVLVTAEQARGSIVLDDGVELRIDHRTTLRMEGDRQFTLDRGAVYVDTTSRTGAAPIYLHARGAVVSDIGTRFEVRDLEDRLRVRVRDGLVNVRRGAETHQATSASELTLTTTGVRTAAAAPFGPDWDWTQRATQAPRIDGTSLAEFLAWVRHESGRQVRFEDEALERRVSSTRVFGTIEGLSIEEALDVVLPSCGLVHRFSSATITIVAAAPGVGR